MLGHVIQEKTGDKGGSKFLLSSFGLKSFIFLNCKVLQVIVYYLFIHIFFLILGVQSHSFDSFGQVSAGEIQWTE